MDQDLATRLEVGLELRVNSSTPDSPNVEVGWCLLPGVLEHLSRLEAINRHIFIVVTDERGGEYRQLEPLERGMAIVMLRTPGKNRIQATIVWNGSTVGALKDEYIGLRRGKYVTDVLSYAGGGLMRGAHHRLGASSIEVTVDRAFFAPDPPDWLNGWVNFWFEGRPIHQCSFRKRAILAFSLQPLVLAVYYPFKALSFLVAGLWYTVMMGRKGVDYSVFLRLVGTNIDDLLTGDARREHSFWAHLWRWQFSVPYLAVVTFFMGFVMLVSSHEKVRFVPFHNFHEYLFCLLWATLIAYVLTAAVCLFILLGGSIPAVKEWLEKPVEKARASARQAEIRRTHELESEMAHLVCSGDVPKPVAVSNLPQSQQSMGIRIRAFKARVCRPYAG